MPCCPRRVARSGLLDLRTQSKGSSVRRTDTPPLTGAGRCDRSKLAELRYVRRCGGPAGNRGVPHHHISEQVGRPPARRMSATESVLFARSKAIAGRSAVATMRTRTFCGPSEPATQSIQDMARKRPGPRPLSQTESCRAALLAAVKEAPDD